MDGNHLRLPGRCPRVGCGKRLRWSAVGVTNGDYSERLHAMEAECRCGLSVQVKPEGQCSIWPRVLGGNEDPSQMTIHEVLEEEGAER